MGVQEQGGDLLSGTVDTQSSEGGSGTTLLDGAAPDKSAGEGSVSGDSKAQAQGKPDGTPLKPWLSAAKPDLQRNETLGKYSSLNDALRGHIELEGKLGAAIQVPGEDATAEDWSKVFARLGRPDSQDGYRFDTVQLPEGVQADANVSAAFKKAAHEANLTQSQAEGMYGFLMQLAGQGVKAGGAAVAVSREQAERDLRGRWKGDFDTRMAAVRRVNAAFFSPELRKLFNLTGLGNHPDVVEAFARIGEVISEDAIIDGDRASAPAGAGMLDYPNTKF